MAEEFDLVVTATVELTLRITLTQPWDSRAPIGEIHRQAAREAVEKLEQLAPKYPQVGNPRVQVVTTERVQRLSR